MNTFFYIAAFVALLTTILAITGKNAIHSLLNLILSLLSISIIFYLLGAPFVAALEVIIYAGAIMVLFIFAIMMLNVGMEKEVERKWLVPKMWILPSIFSLILLLDFIYMLRNRPYKAVAGVIVPPSDVGVSLFSTYLLGVEIAGILLLAGIVGAYHLSRQKKIVFHRYLRKQAQPAPDEITK
ncbi:MAG: NADH-quinone oxidoreductase subunit J [Syntrophothermus sp.]